MPIETKVQTPDKFYIGTSGIVVPVAKTAYPKEFAGKSRLAYYSSLLNSIEVNSSFYKNPRAVTVRKWAAEVDEDFKFTFKLPKTISHAKALQFDASEVSAFISLINEVGHKRGCVLIQLPPSLSIDHFAKLKELIEAIRTADDGRWCLAVEFRNASWYISEVDELLHSFKACRVIHDLPKSATPITTPNEFFYLRFHGENGRYRGSYDDAVLQEYAGSIKDWLRKGKTGFCYFNNTLGNAYNNGKDLRGLLAVDNSM